MGVARARTRVYLSVVARMSRATEPATKGIATMPEQTAVAAANVVEIDGTKKGWPDRLNGVKVTFATIPADASADDAIAFVREHAADDNAVVGFLRSAVEREQTATLRSWLNGKMREPGKSYTREEAKALPTRSAKVSKEDVASFGDGWQIPAPRVSKTRAKIDAAEARARRSEEQLSAAQNALVEMLRKLPAKERNAQIDGLKAGGLIPSDFTLDS